MSAVDDCIPRAVNNRLRVNTTMLTSIADDTSAPGLKRSQCISCVARMIIVAMLPKLQSIHVTSKIERQCCAMFSESEPFTEGDRATYSAGQRLLHADQSARRMFCWDGRTRNRPASPPVDAVRLEELDGET